MTLWNLSSPTLHKEPPLIRGTPTAHKGSSLMAGGGHLFIKILIPSQCKISSNPFISSGKDNGGAMLHPLWQVGVLFIKILLPGQCKKSSNPPFSSGGAFTNLNTLQPL